MVVLDQVTVPLLVSTRPFKPLPPPATMLKTPFAATFKAPDNDPPSQFSVPQWFR